MPLSRSRGFPRLVAQFLLAGLFVFASAQAAAELIELKAARVFDGEAMHEGWSVLVEDERIVFAGPSAKRPQRDVARSIALDEHTLMPGLIEGHSHILLHPYNETPWNDQVLKESEAERVLRASVHARATLMAGVTTIRDLGSEGAGYADVAIRDAIEAGIIDGPRMLVAGPAIVATGSYGPKGFHEGVEVPLGAEAADGYDDLIRTTRRQIGRGIDLVKVYADYRWGPEGSAAPTFTLEELETIVEVAHSSGRAVAAHASTAEAMRRAVLAGVEVIEHGDGATPEVLELMRQHDVALCPTLAAGDAISQYGGWRKGEEPEPARVAAKRRSFAAALKSGVAICFGGDVGVYAHGDNVRELEMMVDYGMDPLAALRAATAGNAELFHLNDRLGRVAPGLYADLIAVRGNPISDVSELRDVVMVMKQGRLYRLDAGAVE
ncbi:MAG: amidohydrolase family protein [Halieaceae bacterium]|nr:amidohydrolase family protein [Halieaceae bacterium]